MSIFTFQRTCQGISRQIVCRFQNKVLDKAKGSFPRTSDVISHLWEAVEQASWACDQAVKMDGVRILVSSCALQNQIPLEFLFLMLGIELGTLACWADVHFARWAILSNRSILKEKTKAAARILSYPKVNIRNVGVGWVFYCEIY